MTRAVQFSEPASEELAEAVRWYETRRGQLGAEFFDAVSATVSHIEANPEIGEQRSADGSTRRVLLRKFPYEIVYRVKPDMIAIVAVAHLKRRPRYWQNRADR